MYGTDFLSSPCRRHVGCSLPLPPPSPQSLGSAIPVLPIWLVGLFSCWPMTLACSGAPYPLCCSRAVRSGFPGRQRHVTTIGVVTGGNPNYRVTFVSRQGGEPGKEGPGEGGECKCRFAIGLLASRQAVQPRVQRVLVLLTRG